MAPAKRNPGAGDTGARKSDQLAKAIGSDLTSLPEDLQTHHIRGIGVAVHHALLKIRDDQGCVFLGEVAENVLRGVTSALAAAVGHEATYAMLRRSADTVIDGGQP